MAAAGVTAPPRLPDLRVTPVAELAAALCDIPSVSGAEGPLADAIESALLMCGHLEVLRDGNALIARTHLGRERRVVVAGHIDTVPVAGNLPTTRVAGTSPEEGEVIVGRGTVDMKGGVAVALALAARLTEPDLDVTWVFYDNEEVASDLNGLGRLVARHPDWLAGDVAVLGEPTDGGVEGGCNGTLRVDVTARGLTAHSARAWRGHNAIHQAVEILERLTDYDPAEVACDGLIYREGLNAVGIRGGIAGNMIPDACTVEVNYRFAPSRTVDDAVAHVRDVFAGLDVEIELTDAAAGARPGLDDPALADAVAALTAVTGGEIGPKYGWTDVARFTQLGIPAFNFGPGDPMLAHADDERVAADQIELCARALAGWLAPDARD